MVKPSNFDELYPGRFIKAGLLKGKKIPVTIADIYFEDLEGEKGPEQKVIVTMTGKKMQLVLCKLNAICVKAMFGPSLSAWIGKRIVLWPTDTVVPMKKGEECIRIWGSPDLAGDISIPVQLPRRKAFNMVMHKMVPGSPAPSLESQPETPPPTDGAEDFGGESA